MGNGSVPLLNDFKGLVVDCNVKFNAHINTIVVLDYQGEEGN